MYEVLYGFLCYEVFQLVIKINGKIGWLKGKRTYWTTYYVSFIFYYFEKKILQSAKAEVFLMISYFTYECI